MKKIILPFFLALGVYTTAQDISRYLFEKESHSILKDSQTVLEILDHKNFTTTKKYTVIIKNKYADYLKNIRIYYDDFRKVKKANVQIRDLKGNEIKAYKLKDFEDKVYDFSNIDSDSRYKVLEPSLTNYPFEIEVNYEVHHSASLFYNFWQPQYYKMRILNAQLKVIDQTRSNLRYTTKNIAEPITTEEKESTTYHWEIENIDPIKNESFNRQMEDYFATVILAPVNFEMDGYQGALSSWELFGQWVNKLNASRNTLEDSDIEAIKNLELQKESSIETIRSVYRFLQETTRYISIQIGIGGYQPFESKMVHEKKYGDCKALSFYTQSLLDIFNIKSYYTLINAGAEKKDLDTGFPSPYFNHAILTVPIEKDTLFLECTSQTKPFGYAGKFTGNRKALLIDHDKSQLINTQRYTTEDNRQENNIHVAFDLSNGASKVTVTKNYYGTEIEHHGFLDQYQKTEKKKLNWIQDTFDFGGAITIDSFTLFPIQGDIFPQGGFELMFSNKKEAVKRGNRMFISPYKYMTRSPQIPNENERKTPVRIRFGYQVKDRITYTMDHSNFNIENLKDDLHIESEYGSYALTIEQQANSVVLSRTFQLNEGIYAPDEFEAFKAFLITVKKNDKTKIILKFP